jgi:flagellum-specific peptidoglycan hydrolase FlgJ
MRAHTWEFYKDKRGEHRWRRKASNGLIIGASTEGYKNKADAIANAVANGYTPHSPTMTRAQYIAYVAPHATAASFEYPTLFVSLAIAQAALESGNGRSQLAAKYNNHFGIKANSAWKGKVVSLRTNEVYDGKQVTVVDGFRAYDTIEDSFADRNRFLARNNRYTSAGVFSAPTPQEQARALQHAGYATDPDYANKLIGIMKANGLERFDAKPEPEPERVPEPAPERVPEPMLPVPPPNEHPRPPEPPPIPIPTPPPVKHSLAMRIFDAIVKLIRK